MKTAHFVCAVLTTAVAVLLTYKIPFFHKSAPLSLGLAAVAVTTWYGGMIPGLLAALLAMVSIDFFVFQPEFHLMATSDQAARLGTFACLAVLLGWLDLTRDSAERSLRDTEQRLKLALEAARMGTWDYNMITGEFWWSRSLEKIFGREQGIFARNYEEFFGYIHPDDRDAFTGAVTRTIEDGMDYEVEHRIVRADQSIVWVNTRGRIFYNGKGQPERVIGVAIDIGDKS